MDDKMLAALASSWYESISLDCERNGLSIDDKQIAIMGMLIALTQEIAEAKNQGTLATADALARAFLAAARKLAPQGEVQ